MTREHDTYRSLFLAGLVVLAAAAGAVAAVGTVGAQDAGNDSGGNASEEAFYSPSADDPLNVRFRDCCANTVGSVEGGVLNLNIVYGSAEQPYDVEITATNLSDDQVEAITEDDAPLGPTDLDRTDIVGMDFADVPAGEYTFTVSVVGEDAEETIPLEITGESAATDGAANESSANTTADNETTMANETTTANGTDATNATATETEMGAGNETGNGTTMANDTMGNATMANGTGTTMTNGTDATTTEGSTTANATGGNASISADPAGANVSTNHTVSAVATDANASGNLSQVVVDYGESNASFGLVLNNLRSVTLGDQNVTTNTTVVSDGPNDRNLTFNFDGSVDVTEGDRITMTYGGMTNPPEPGNYTVGIAVNDGTTTNATLNVTEANESMMATETTGVTTTAGGNGTTESTTTASEMGATENTTQATEGAATTAGNDDTATGDDGAGGNDSGGNASGGEETTNAGGPGFTLIAGVVALLAAALVAARRD